MLNQVILVGRIVHSVKLEARSNTQDKTLLIEIGNGDVSSTTIPCVLSEELANTVEEYCEEGSTIGIKAELENEEDKITVVVQKLTFINTSK